jgi:hypothetical protein
MHKECTSNYAINPTPELYLRSNRTLLPARVIAALDFGGCVSFVVCACRGLVARLPRRGARQNEFGSAASTRSRARWRAVALLGYVVVPELATSGDEAARSPPRPRAPGLRG